MYKQTLPPLKRAWYMHMLVILGIIAVILAVAFIRAALYIIISSKPLQMFIDILCLTALGAAAWFVIRYSCTSYVYMLENGLLTLQAIRARRVVNELCVHTEDISRIISGRQKPLRRFCSEGLTLEYTGGSVLFAPDETLLELLTSKAE